MNDKLITSIIPKIHFRLLFFLLFLFFTGFFTFIALLEGFSVSQLKLGGVKLEQLYLKWDDRLHIKIYKIDLNALADNQEPIDLKPLSQLPKWIKWTQMWVQSIDINSIEYDKTHLSVHYEANKTGKIALHHNEIDYKSDFTLDPTTLNLTIRSYCSSNDTNITGSFVVMIPNQTIKADLTIKLPKTPLITADIHGDTHSIHFTLNTATPLSTITPLVDYLGVDEETRPWITTHAKANRFILDKFIGHIKYNAPESPIEQIYASARIEDAAYTFDTALEPIHAKQVKLVFKKGKLYIMPTYGEFYKLPTQKSWLYIDFTTPHTMLYANIITQEGKLNTPILNMLQHYKITVPVEQLQGKCAVNLKLGIDLHTYDTTAKGVFRPSASELLLNGFRFTTNGGLVKLDTHKVAFEGFNAHHKNLIHASVDGHYDAKKESGNVRVIPTNITPTGNRNDFSMIIGKEHPQINYLISSKGDRLDITPSKWNVYGDTVSIAGISAPFNYADSSMMLTKLPFTLSNKIKGVLSGNIGSKRTNLLLQIDQLDYKGIKLRRKPIFVRFTKEINSTSITVPTSSWEFGGEIVSISPINGKIIQDNIIFNNISIKAEGQFASNLSGKYNLSSSSGDLILNNLTPYNGKLAPYIDMIDREKLQFKSSNNSFLLHSDQLHIDLETIADGWRMKIDDISMLSKKSPILRQYEIANGHLNLYYLPKENRYTFDGEIIYPYKIMMVGDESLSKYRFSGSAQNGKSLIRINDRLTIQYADTIDIRANNMGMNVPELYRWINKRQHSNTDVSNETKKIEKKIHLYVTNSYLHLMKSRKIVADTITADMSQDIIEGRMMHDQGSADFTIANDLFYIEGSRFNDRFMEHLFAFSNFYGGEFSFKAQGSPNGISGLVKIDNTILKEYRLLNNVLSFINTVPSLATFSLPNYNTKGLPVKEAYAHFTYHKDIISVDNLVVNSPEIKLLGNTRGNIATDTIEGEITLKTDLGSSLSKVPVVGYILFGDDGSLSTTLKLTGKLSDPKVETSIAKEIGIAPFNLLKRTVTYPFKWMLEDKKK